MQNKLDREELLENLLNIIPLLHKKMFKGCSGRSITRHQMGILRLIQEENGKSMKYYGNKLMISKPNLTTVVSKFIEEGLLERKQDTVDRRIINLYITIKGQDYLNTHKLQMKKELLKNLSILNDEDVERLCDNFKEIGIIFNKFK